MYSKLISSLNKRGFKAFECKTADEAAKAVVGLIKKNATVGMGGCTTAIEMNLPEILEENGIVTIIPGRGENTDFTTSIKRAMQSDYFVLSANAITESGIIVNADGTGNRVAAAIFGVPTVIYLIGKNKICADMESAIRRVRDYATPINAKRFCSGLPCIEEGKCTDCDSPDCICRVFTIMEKCPRSTESYVFIIDEELGI